MLASLDNIDRPMHGVLGHKRVVFSIFWNFKELFGIKGSISEHFEVIDSGNVLLLLIVLESHQTIVERIDRTEFFQKLLVGSFFLSSNFVLVAFLDLPALHEFILDFIDRLAGMRDDVELIGDLLRPYSKIVAFPGVERFAGTMVF